jgi:hypothetical protein
MQCCPLSDYDGDSQCSQTTERRARKAHRCDECGDEIKAGDRYRFSSGIADREPWDFKSCLLCAEIRKHFSCGRAQSLGTMWDDLAENFFPNMRAGGPCMEGLSPAAKARLFERCLKWRIERDS